MFFQRTKSFFYGLFLPLESARLIASRKSLIFWSIIPVALTIVLYVYVIGSLQDNVLRLLQDWIASLGWDPEGWMAWIAKVLARVLLIVVGALTFTFASTIVASPFNDFLAETAEKFAAPPLPPVSPPSFLDRVRLIGIDVGKSVAATVAGICALLLSWLPIVNVVAFAIAFLLICFQFTSYPQTRRSVTVRGGLAFLWRHLFACAGFGLAASVLLAIPFVASFALPVCVVGGTLLVARAPGSGGPTPLRPLK